MTPAVGQIWGDKDGTPWSDYVILAYFPAAHAVLFAARHDVHAMVMDDDLWVRAHEYLRESSEA